MVERGRDAFVEDKLSNGNTREKEALEYLQRHKIGELLDNFTSMLLYSRPDEPKKYIIELLEKLIKARTVHVDAPMVFDQLNIDAVFQMLDPTNKGMIALEQYKAALTTLGLHNFDMHPAGGDLDKITLDTFSREAKKCLSKDSATWYDRTADHGLRR